MNVQNICERVILNMHVTGNYFLNMYLAHREVKYAGKKYVILYILFKNMK